MDVPDGINRDAQGVGSGRQKYRKREGKKETEKGPQRGRERDMDEYEGGGRLELGGAGEGSMNKIQYLLRSSLF